MIIESSDHGICISDYALFILDMMVARFKEIISSVWGMRLKDKHYLSICPLSLSWYQPRQTESNSAALQGSPILEHKTLEMPRMNVCCCQRPLHKPTQCQIILQHSLCYHWKGVMRRKCLMIHVELKPSHALENKIIWVYFNLPGW